MAGFPRTVVGGVSLSRMIIGTNWFLGFSHTSQAKDDLIKGYVDRKTMADIIEVFVRAGVDTIMGLMTRPILHEAVLDVQERTGQKLIQVSTPGIAVSPSTPEQGFDPAAVAKVLDAEVAVGADFCFPHQSTTDALVDRCTRKIRHIDTLSRMIRERGMRPGLSTHMPESIVYADESGADVDTYISIYNSMGFLMQIEVDWVASIIRDAKKPVMTIKPMASGQLRPFQGLSFAWATLRPIDMVTVGCMTPDEARECIDLSLAALTGREASIQLQETRSKAVVKRQ